MSRIALQESIAVVIDIQERLFPHIYANQELCANTIKLLKGLQALDVPMIVTEQYTKGLGGTIQEIRDHLGIFTPFEKISFSCCGSKEFMEVLQTSGRKNVIISGIETHICVQQSVLDLLKDGFTPIVVEDCVSSRKPNDKEIAIRRMHRAGAIITTYESILLELCEVAGTEVFKTISRIIK
ncbi:MAG TPA: hydrolase [Patescibacteria group bacterium]|nr:hydrolase [Patescibacteria group bacterium]